MLADVWNELAPRVGEWAQTGIQGLGGAAVAGLFLYVFIKGSGGGNDKS